VQQRERERKRSKREHRHVSVWVRASGTRRTKKIKHEKSIVEEKRSDVLRPNYVPPLPHAVAVAAAATALQGARVRTVNERRRH